ncbi:MAG TPA: COX15/CtaA family protein [Patescibacteria group bacterium]|nr:COX15/CtaA family protein [Patescibacteria group bacterium]
MARVTSKKPAEKKRKEKKEPSLKPVMRWLFFCAASVFIMAVIGAITRLTESGLSIVRWEPIAGALPPLNAAEWDKAFDAYKQSPQYLKVNSGMDLAAFKQIFFWEWLHRLWGRLIGVFYALPLLYFWGRIPADKRPAFLGILALGGLQGLIGWWMVKSGLVNDPAVSHYRLALHLMTAVVIYACLFRLALVIGMRPVRDAGKLSRLRGFVRACIGAVLLTMTWGAFTAGLDAGMVYNDTFPYMGSELWPAELLQTKPLWRAILTEHASVQFIHRLLAVLAFIKILLLVKRALPFNPPARLRKILVGLAVAACAQVGLGVATVMSHVNIHAAASHQAGALVLLTLLVWLLHEIPVMKKEQQA